MFQNYAHEENFPLKGYAGIMAGFGVYLLAFAKYSRPPYAFLSNRDLILLGIATHKLTRVMTKDWVTSPLRAPFVKFKEGLGAGEVSEKSRGDGLQRAIGDLITCPFCSGPWVGSALLFSFLKFPFVTRTFASIFVLTTVSDFLHLTYQTLREKEKRLKIS